MINRFKTNTVKHTQDTLDSFKSIINLKLWFVVFLILEKTDKKY